MTSSPQVVVSERENNSPDDLGTNADLDRPDPISAKRNEPATSLEQPLAELRRRTESDPFANPILLLAMQIGRQLESAELTLDQLEQMIQCLTIESFERRSERIGRYLGECRHTANVEQLARLLRGLTRRGDSAVPFDQFLECHRA